MIRVYADGTYRDWVMECDSHSLAVTCSHWEDAYEIALGHAYFKHVKAELCQTKGHSWTYNWDSIPVEKWGVRSEPWKCRNCSELGWALT